MTLETMLIFILIILLLALLILWLNSKKQNEELKKKVEELEFQQRSTVVKHGRNWEHFVPLMDDFEKIAKKEDSIFLGMPIDYISFGEDAVKFIEVKTGNSGLNNRQKKIKNLVEQKKVEWHELRF